MKNACKNYKVISLLCIWKRKIGRENSSPGYLSRHRNHARTKSFFCAHKGMGNILHIGKVRYVFTTSYNKLKWETILLIQRSTKSLPAYASKKHYEIYCAQLREKKKIKLHAKTAAVNKREIVTTYYRVKQLASQVASSHFVTRRAGKWSSICRDANKKT